MVRVLFLLALLFSSPALADVDSLAQQVEATRIELSRVEYDISQSWEEGQRLAGEYNVGEASEDDDRRATFTQKRLEHAAKQQQLILRMYDLQQQLQDQEAALAEERRKSGGQ